MATIRQRQAARRNVSKARAAATRKRTIKKLPKSVRSDLGRQAAKGRQRGGAAGRRLEDRNRQQLYRSSVGVSRSRSSVPKPASRSCSAT